jgi:tetratricopeptide (TPR) repeat protein
MILGTVQIPSPTQVRLVSNIVLETGEIDEPYGTGGDLDDILSLEKDLAIRTAEALGYQLTDNEIQRIRQNVPQNLAAFLAFSRGLMAEDIGDFEAAASHYSDAIRADPTYRDAQRRLRESVGAGVLSGTSERDVTSLPTEVDQALGEVAGSETTAEGLGTAGILSSTLASSIIDVASHQAERATEHVGSSTPSEVVVEPPAVPPALTAYIRITITIPRF